MQTAWISILYFNIPSAVSFPPHCFSAQRRNRRGRTVIARCERLLTQHLCWTCEMPCTCESLGVMQNHTQRKPTPSQTELPRFKPFLSNLARKLWPSPYLFHIKISQVEAFSYTPEGVWWRWWIAVFALTHIHPVEKTMTSSGRKSYLLSTGALQWSLVYCGGYVPRNKRNPQNLSNSPSGNLPPVKYRNSKTAKGEPRYREGQLCETC